MIEENAGNPIANQQQAFFRSQNYFRTQIEQFEHI
jgi:hypothetical protein